MSAAEKAPPIVPVGGRAEDWGFIPGFLDTGDPRPAREQIDSHYMGGWMSMKKGFSFDRERGLLCHPGDPPMEERSALLFRDEILILFPHAWVLILQPDGKWDVARLD